MYWYSSVIKNDLLTISNHSILINNWDQDRVSLKQKYFSFFSNRARWRDNRTIFNTPNPRLMNVSLLRDNKLLHGQERRGSRMSVRLPSRQPSMASLRPHSPNASIGKLGLYPWIRGRARVSFPYFSIPFVRVVVDVWYGALRLMIFPRS